MSLLRVHLSIRPKIKNIYSYLFLFAILGLSLTYAIYNNVTLKIINFFIIPITFTAYVLSIRYPAWKNPNITYILKILEKMYIQSIGSMHKSIVFLYQSIKIYKPKKLSKNHRHILNGLAISLPLLILICSLLISADEVFKSLVFENLNFINFRIKISVHSVIIFCVFLYLFGYLWSLKYNDFNYNENIKYKKFLEPITVITIMTSLCFIYLVFIIIQFSYLYIGNGQLPNHVNYAQYARKGFFELLLVTFINISIISFVILSTKKRTKLQEYITKASYSLLVLFTMNLLVSSFYRMNLYEKAFGYTQPRLFVQFFIVFLGISLTALFIWIWKREFQIFKFTVVLSVIIYLILNFSNIDRIIAKHNINRYQH